MPSFRTLLFLIIVVVAASAASAYAAANKIQNNAILISNKANVTATPISVGTASGGTVEQLFVHEGQTVVNGDTLLILKNSDKSEEKIIAQHSGVISSIEVTQDSFVKPSSELFKLVDPANLFVTAELKISADQFLQLQTGMPLSIQIGSGSHFSGILSGIEPEYDASTETAIIYCAFKDTTDTQRLAPGLPAQVQVTLPSTSLDFVNRQLARLKR